MAALVFSTVLFLSLLLVNLLVIQPFHLFQWLHIPQLFVWGLALVLFAWAFGDDSAPWI